MTPIDKLRASKSAIILTKYIILYMSSKKKDLASPELKIPIIFN